MESSIVRHRQRVPLWFVITTAVATADAATVAVEYDDDDDDVVTVHLGSPRYNRSRET